jgi:hypothetical protein
MTLMALMTRMPLRALNGALGDEWLSVNQRPTVHSVAKGGSDVQWLTIGRL